MIQRTQPAEAQPLAGTTRPERSMVRDQTKRQPILFYTRNFDEVASLSLPVDGNGLKSLLIEIHFVINIEKHCN